MKNIINTIAWGIISILIGLMAFSYYEQFKPLKLLEIKTPQHVLTPKVKAGEDVIYTSDYCRYTNIPAHVYKSFVGPTIINLPFIVSSTEKGCRVIDVHVTVPVYAVAGKYKIKTDAEFQVTGTRLDRVYFETDEFEVIASTTTTHE